MSETSDLYMRVWRTGSGVWYIVTDDTFRNGVCPSTKADFQGPFRRYSKQWAVVHSLMQREEYRCVDFNVGVPSYRFPLSVYVEECRTMSTEGEIRPFRRTKVSQVVTTAKRRT